MIIKSIGVGAFILKQLELGLLAFADTIAAILWGLKAPVAFARTYEKKKKYTYSTAILYLRRRNFC